jgi:hypothetical protein
MLLHASGRALSPVHSTAAHNSRPDEAVRGIRPALEAWVIAAQHLVPLVSVLPANTGTSVCGQCAQCRRAATQVADTEQWSQVGWRAG